MLVTKKVRTNSGLKFEQNTTYFLSIVFNVDFNIVLSKGKTPVKEIPEVHW